MGSYCSLSFNGIDILSSKSVIPDNLIALFQETDRVVRNVPETEDEDARTDVVYEAPRSAISRTLDLLGYTEQIVQERFAHWRAREIEDWTDYYAENTDDQDRRDSQSASGT